MIKHKVVVIGGGTFNHISCHLSLAAPAFGGTAKQLHQMFTNAGALESQLVLTKMADSSSKLITNDDVATYIQEILINDPTIKIVVMNAAICDFEIENPGEGRLSSAKDYDVTLKGIRGKILSIIRELRPDVIVAGFKTTHGASAATQLARAALSIHDNDLDIVFANDVQTRSNLLLNRHLSVYRGSREDLLLRLVHETTVMYRSAAWFG